jgi:hypothetical protein
MHLFALFALLFLLGGTYNLTQGNLANALAGILLGGLAVAAAVMLQALERKEAAFLRFLRRNRERIREGGVVYQGVRIRPSTVLVRYGFCVSCGVFSFRFTPGLWLPRGSWLPRLGFSCISLVFGWWGIPWGLLWTPQTIIRNLSGGERTTVSALIGRRKRRRRRRSQSSPPRTRRQKAPLRRRAHSRAAVLAR